MSATTSQAPLPARTSGWRFRWRVMTSSKVAVFGLVVLTALLLLALLGGVLRRYGIDEVGAGMPLAAPAWAHWMGTDELGRDIFSRAVSGLRVSLVIGVSATLVGTVVGVVVGATAGFFGGVVDRVLMRMTEVFMVIPEFFLALVLVSLYGASIYNIILAIAVLAWPLQARVVRGEVLSLKSRAFVDAARVTGVGNRTLVFAEIVPNLLGPVIVTATFQIGWAMLIEAGLAYLGLGDPSTVSLGLMLQQSQSIIAQAWWASAIPGLLLFLAVLSTNLVGNALNDALNPRARGRG